MHAHVSSFYVLFLHLVLTAGIPTVPSTDEPSRYFPLGPVSDTQNDTFGSVEAPLDTDIAVSSYSEPLIRCQTNGDKYKAKIGWEDLVQTVPF